MSIGLSKVIILVEDQSSTTLVSQENKDMGIGPEGENGLVLNWG